VNEADTPWTNMASRVVRVLLTRKGFSYAALSGALSILGVTENGRSLASRVSRGRIKLALLLQIISVTKAKVPHLWEQPLNMAGTWEDLSKAVVSAELSRQPSVTLDELAHRLVRLGADLTEKTLVLHLSNGTLSLPVFLQCLVALGSSSLELYVDYEDLVLAARASAAAVAE